MIADRIINLLRHVPVATADLISDDLEAQHDEPVDPAEVQAALHALDDAGRVIMRNGWYRLSEAEKARIE
jgi:hypothetical protein